MHLWQIKKLDSVSVFKYAGSFRMTLSHRWRDFWGAEHSTLEKCRIELKVTRFEPEYLGKLAFYLEGLDRDIKKAHERPSIGVLLCASKDDEVVEYALSRTLSPALIAEYQTQLPDKRLLRAKLHEFSLQNATEEPGKIAAPSKKRRTRKKA